MTVALSDYLVVSALLFGVGIYGLMTKRNAMRLVFSVEILVNAANINFIAFNRYLWSSAVGQ
ncbi:MAG: NADH-quinone oxidoreductase subunit NuoK, partial [Nitrososphaerales archaeon]